MSATRRWFVREAIRSGLTWTQAVMVGILAEERGSSAAQAMLDYCKKYNAREQERLPEVAP